MDSALQSSQRTDQFSLSFLYGGMVQYRCREVLAPRVLPDWEMVLIIEGHVVYSAEQREYAAPPGTVILARPGVHEAYRWDPVGQTRHAYLHFTIEQMPEDWPAPESWPIIQTNPDPLLPVLFRHVLQRTTISGRGAAERPSRIDCRAVETLISLYLEQHQAERSQLEPSRPVSVNYAINLMRETLDEDPRRKLALKDLARAACVTEKHLCRLFQNSFGQSPMRTYRLMKLQLAVVLLSQSNLTIGEIANRCGFEDQLYFSRCFSKTFDRSPTTIRKQVLAGSPPPQSPLPIDITPRVYW